MSQRDREEQKWQQVKPEPTFPDTPKEQEAPKLPDAYLPWPYAPDIIREEAKAEELKEEEKVELLSSEEQNSSKNDRSSEELSEGSHGEISDSELDEQIIRHLPSKFPW